MMEYLAQFLISHANEEGRMETSNILIYILLRFGVQNRRGFSKHMVVPDGNWNNTMLVIDEMRLRFPKSSVKFCKY